jgi:TP901 family phage tail tape measure protein
MGVETDASLLIVIKARDEAAGVLSASKDSVSSWGGAFKVAAGAAAAVVTVAVGVGAAAMKMASDFNDAMTQVQTQGGISNKVMESMKQGVLDLSAQFGISATDLANALMPIAAEGYSGAAGLQVLSSAAMGSRAYNADLTTTTLALTTAMKDYNFNAGQSQHVMDVLGAATASGRTTFQDLAGSISTILPLTASLKISFEGVMGAITQMTSQGISAQNATQELRFAISAIEKPTSQATDALGSVGLTTKQLVTTLQSGPDGLINTLSEVQEAVGKKFPAGSSAYMAALSAIMGGVRGLQPVLALTGTHLQATITATNGLADASKNGGYAAQSWAAVQQNLSTKIDQARQTVNGYLIELGEHLEPVVSAAVGMFSADLPKAVNLMERAFSAAGVVFKPLADAFGQVIANIKNGLGWVDDLDGAVLAIARDFGASGSTLRSINGDVQEFGKVANAAGSLVKGALVVAFNLAVDALRVLGAILKEAVTHFNDLKVPLEVVVGLFVAWKAALAVSAIQSAFVGIIEQMTLFAMRGGIMAVVNGIMTSSFWALDAAMNANPFFLVMVAIVALIAVVILIATHFQQVKDVLGSFGNAVAGAFKAVLGLAGDVVAWFGQHWVTILGILLAPFGPGLIILLIAHWGAVTTFLGNAVKDLLTLVWNILKALPGLFLTILISIPLYIVTGFIYITKVFYDLSNDLLNWAVTEIPKIVTAVVNFVLAIPGDIKTGLEMIVKIFTDAFTAAWDWLSVNVPKMISAVINFVLAIPGDIKAGLGILGGIIGGAFETALTATGNQIGSWAGTLKNWFLNLPGAIGGWLASLPGTMLNIGKGIINAIINGIGAGISGIGHALTNALHGAVAALPGPLQGIAKSLGLAAGGIVKARPGGTIITAGEAGEDEWVIPASKMRALILQAGTQTSGVSPLPTGAAGAADGGTTNITLQLDGKTVAQVVSKHQGRIYRQQAPRLGAA